MLALAYTTSDLYKEAIDKDSRVSYISGELVTTKGTTITIDNQAIDSGSLYITNQCVSSDAFAYGSVFAAEAGITLKTDIDRYSLYDSEISLSYNLLLSNGEYETIPLGKFYVNEPNRIGKSISIKAYDGMTKLEKDVEENTTGTPYELLSYIGDKCGIELAQTKDEIDALVNGLVLLSVAIDRVDTYRDLLSYIAQVTCTFAIFDREGKLKLCEFQTTPSRIIEAKRRASSKFSDFETYFSSAKSHFLVGGTYQGYLCNDPEIKDGLIYDVGEVPIVQGLDDTNQEVLNSMFENLKGIKYVPCDITFNGDPSVDLGDMVTNIDRFGNEITSLVTFYKWTYRGSHQLKSAGSNPKLSSVKEKKSKDLANMQAEINAKTVVVYPYTNSSAITVKGGESVRDMKEVVRIAFAVNEDLTALFMATISFNMDYDGFVELSSYIDSVYYENSSICQYCQEGPNVITFMNYITCKKGTNYKFSVLAKTYCEETSLRVNEAKIQTNENARDAIITAYEDIVSALRGASKVPITNLDGSIAYTVVKPITNVPKMTIQKYDVKAAIFGQGLAGQVSWDGTITFEEMFGTFDIPTPMMIKPKDAVSTEIIVSKTNNITEAFGTITVNMPKMQDIVDEMILNEIMDNYTVTTAKVMEYELTNDIDTNDDSFKVRTTFDYESEALEIDVGNACILSLDESGLKDIQSIELEVV